MSTAILEPPGTSERVAGELPIVEPISPTQPPAFAQPYPDNAVMRALLKGPILAWRLGLGPLLGRGVLILTAAGRKSGLPRHTPLGYSRVNGRKFVFSLRGPGTDWYRNMTANPHVTVQTAEGSEPALARRVTDDEEIWSAYEFLGRLPVMKQWAASFGVELSRESLVAHKADFILVTFDPTTEATPPPVRADLKWVLPVLGVGMLLVCLAAAARLRR